MSRATADALQELDLNLLRVFDALRVEGSVSGAARRLGITQPGASRALARLRDALGDPLFVSDHGGLRLTPHAEAIADQIRGALELLTTGIARAAFDPGRSERRFTIWMSNDSESLLMPALCQRLEREAPGVRLRVVGAALELGRMLGQGTIDLGISVEVPDAPRTVARLLLRDELVAAARRDHPVFDRGRLTPSACDGFGRIVMAAELRGRGWSDATRVQSQSFVASALLAARGDSIVILARLLAIELERHQLLRILPMPIEHGRIDLTMHWHERLQVDAGHRWLRHMLRDVARQLEAAGDAYAERAAATKLAPVAGTAPWG